MRCQRRHHEQEPYTDNLACPPSTQNHITKSILCSIFQWTAPCRQMNYSISSKLRQVIDVAFSAVRSMNAYSALSRKTRKWRAFGEEMVCYRFHFHVFSLFLSFSLSTIQTFLSILIPDIHLHQFAPSFSISLSYLHLHRFGPSESSYQAAIHSERKGGVSQMVRKGRMN